MIEKMKQCKFLLMLLMLFLGMGAYAQTTVEFVAGTDKGSNSQFGFLAASDQIEKDGVTMSSDNAVFDADVYQTQKTAFSNRKLTFSSKKNITKIEFEGGENLALLTADSFDASTGVWSGKATDIRFTISSKGLVKFTKVTVTLDDKKVTTLAFADAETVAYVDLTKKSYTFPVVLKHDDTELKGMPIRYESTNPEVATIDATGNVEPKTVGTTVLKAFFDGNDSYEPSQAEVTFNVVDGKNIFTETFDKMKDEGGNDSNFNVWGSGNLSSGDCDNAGWSHSGVGNGKADKCVRIEMSASLTTPALTNLKGNAFLFFRAAQNRNAATSIDLSISGGGSLSEKSVKLEKTFNDYVVLIKDGTPETKIKFSCSAFGCFFLDDVKIERAIVLDEATDNAQTLSDNDQLTVNVAFNRPLSPDYWNTVALPFDVQAADMSKIFGEDVKVKAFDRWDASAQTLFFKNAAAIVAGTPYLVKPAAAVGSLMLTDIKVVADAKTVTSSPVAFHAIFSPTTINASDVFLGKDGMLYRPDTDVEGADNMKGFRAFFSGLTDLTNAKVNIDGTLTSIGSISGNASVEAAKVYTIDGQYVGNSTKGLKKGFYIVGGKKVVL